MTRRPGFPLFHSTVEWHLWLLIKSAGLPIPEREYGCVPGRRWRFDFAWPESMLAVEVEGGSWIAGRHTRGKGFQEDCEKYNTALVNGWAVLRVTPEQVSNGQAVAWIERLLL